MRKWIALILMLALVSLMGMTVAAQPAPIDDLTSPAQYYPEDTAFFTVIRTDDGYIDDLDNLLALINSNTGGMLPPEASSVTAILDQLSIQATGQPFSVSFRSWLGDSVAIGLTDVEFFSVLNDPEAQQEFEAADIPLLIAVDITDREIAGEFAAGFTQVPEGVETAAFDLYEGEEFSAVVADDVMLIGYDPDVLGEAVTGDFTGLEADETFNETLESFPAEGYNILLYIDGESIVELNRINIETTFEAFSAQSGVDVSGLQETLLENINIASTAIGFTILEERNLVIDSLSLMNEPMEGPGAIEQVPVDLSFAEYIPSHAQFVIHDNGFGPDFLALFDALDALGAAAEELVAAVVNDPETFNALTNQRPGFDDILQQADEIDYSTIKVGGFLLNQLTTLYAGFTGLNLENDILSWMDGDYALYASLLAVENLDFTFDIAYLTEATDAEAAANIVTRMAEVAELYELDFDLEAIGGGEALSLTAPLRAPLALLSGLPGDVLFNTPELDFLVGSNDEVFVVSSRPGAEFALEPLENSLASRDEFQNAGSLLLEDTVLVWYIGLPALVNELPGLRDLAEPETLQQLSFALSQVETLTISAATPDDTTAIQRLTLTIPESVVPLMTPETTEAEDSIIAVASSTDDLGTLVAALGNVDGAVEVLNTPGAYTVFAPTNDAFLAAFQELGVTQEEILQDESTLSDLLSYHVVLGEFTALDLAELDGETLETGLPDAEIRVSVDADGNIFLNETIQVITADVAASNGVIHIIDGVLMPPDMMMEEEELVTEEAPPTLTPIPDPTATAAPTEAPTEEPADPATTEEAES